VKQTYHWQRFWCPRSSQINLADGGYLYNPDEKSGLAYNQDLVTLEEIADVPCLVLLGEPGIGKSHELENLKVFTEQKICDPNQILELNLRSCTNLQDDLFKDEIFTDWLRDNYDLYLFLDSLDEGLLNIQSLAIGLIDELKKPKYRNHINRLHLRLACRTFVFPAILEEELKEFWNKDNFAIYELAPLRRIDVIEAAKPESFSADDFLREIDRKNVAALAIKPITLGFLLNTYRRHNGQFPLNQKLYELYHDGCKLLCEEVNKNRQGSGKKGKFNSDQRLIVAARIAAVTIFTNRFAIWTEVDQGNVPAEDIFIQTLYSDCETANGNRFPVTREVIEEVLDTGLFSSRGSKRMGWAHQTYAEFLAAWYLKQHNLNLNQILNLIIHPDSRVVPQLQETVAWLASMIPEVFQELLKTDSDVLLQSDISTIDDQNKAQLVESLLRLHNEEKLKYNLRRYSNLNYPGLAELLESYIRDSSKSQWSRLVAIDIARDCNVKAVQDSLVDIALDPTQLHIVRRHTAFTICDLGDEEAKARLKPLVFGIARDGPDDDLKGYGLRAVWPEHITIEELLNHLWQPQQGEAFPIIGGVYQDFIAQELVQHLRLSDLPVMLKWLKQLLRKYDLHYPFDQLADSVMLKAWQNFDEIGVFEAFAEVAVLRLKQYDRILGDRLYQGSTFDSFDSTRDASVEPLLRESNEKRRKLIETIVLLISESESYFLCSTDIVCSEDILWIIERITSAESPRLADAWVKLLRQTLNWHNLYWKNTKHIDAILEARKISSAMQSEFEIEIELDSEKAQQAKASYLQSQNMLKPPEPEPILYPPPKQRVLAALEKVEAGQPQLWWQVVVEMTLIPTSKKYFHKHIFELDITKLPGWKEAEADTKIRIIETAKEYLDAGDPKTQTWIRTNNFSHPPFAGYQALYLIAKEEPDLISKISHNTWTKWIPIILKSINFPPINREYKKDEACQKIVRTAYQSIPNKFIETLIILMIQNNYQPRTFDPDDIYQLTNELLGQCLASLILDRVPDKNLNAGMLEILLRDLFEHDVDKAKEIATSFLPKEVPESGEARDKASVAARLIVLNPDNSSWSVFWSAVQQDHKFGQEILKAIASPAFHEGKIKHQLKEDYLAELYIFLTQQYSDFEQAEPENQEPRGIEAYILGELDGIRRLKNYIPQYLQERGTLEACDALRKIIHKLPELKDTLNWRLLETEALARRITWQPPTPEEFLQLVISRDPSNSDLSNQLDTIEKKMEDEPKTDNSIHISELHNSSVNHISTSSNSSINQPDSKKGINWGNWLAVIGSIVTIIGIIVALYPEEVKQWLDYIRFPKVEQQSTPKSQ
jgi:predicted NACHT family NTPase